MTHPASPGLRNRLTRRVSLTVRTAVDDDRYPFEVFVSADECALREDSVVCCSQLRTVSIDHRITDVVGSIPDARLPEVDTALEYSLGLRSV